MQTFTSESAKPRCDGGTEGIPGLNLRERRELNKGLGDGFTRAFELALLPLLFGGIGYVVDGFLGIRPVVTIALVLYAVVGIFLRSWYGYDREMRAREAEGSWNRSTLRPPAGDARR